MSNIYNITDSQDGKTLFTIGTDTNERDDQLSAIKTQTDKIWYSSTTGASDTLSKQEKSILDSTINGDWNEIFEALLRKNDIMYKIVNIKKI